MGPYLIWVWSTVWIEGLEGLVFLSCGGERAKLRPSAERSGKPSAADRGISGVSPGDILKTTT